MATNQRKKRVGDAPQVVTRKGAGDAAHSVTSDPAQPVTGLNVDNINNKPAKRRYKPRARRCACGCGVVFTPSSRTPKQRFATDACRQRGHRAKLPKKPRRSNGVERLTCEQCGTWYVGTVGKGRKYCTSTCKRLAAKARREAVAEALALALALPIELGRERVDLLGMADAQREAEGLQALAALAG